jgi:hypothetical protein
MARYSDDENINQAVLAAICLLDPDGPFSCPWSPPRVKRGTHGIKWIVQRIRAQYGDAAAETIKIVLH